MKLTRVAMRTYDQVSNYNFQMSLLDTDGKELHAPVMCKDYFTDVMWSETVKEEVVNVYRFNWIPGTLPNSTRLWFAAYNPDHPKWSLDWAHNLEAFLPYFDAKFGVTPTLVEQDETKTAVILGADRKGWGQSPAHISLFTTLMRAGTMAPRDMDPWDYISSDIGSAVGKKVTSVPEGQHVAIDLSRNPYLARNIERLRKGVKKKVFSDFGSAYGVHDFGIITSFCHLDN